MEVKGLETTSPLFKKITMTYKEAYNKIIDAYFRDEIKPMDMKFCFCGTLCDGVIKRFNSDLRFRNDWFERWVSKDYTYHQLKIMEEALLTPLIGFYVYKVNERHGTQWAFINDTPIEVEKTQEYENGLFAGICAALDVLKQIHKERGEDIDDVPIFKKRQLLQ